MDLIEGGDDEEEEDELPDLPEVKYNLLTMSTSTFEYHDEELED